MNAPAWTTPRDNTRRLKVLALALTALTLILLFIDRNGYPASTWSQHLPQPHFAAEYSTFFGNKPKSTTPLASIAESSTTTSPAEESTSASWTHLSSTMPAKNIPTGDLQKPPTALSNATATMSGADTGHSHSVTVVVASQASDDTSWLEEVHKDWRRIVYVADDPQAVLGVPINKGNEGMVYLTYVIEHYDVLADVNVFHHSGRYQWHNDDPLFDAVRVLKRLQLPYVQSQGYVSLRCTWVIGCPTGIHPSNEDDEDRSIDALGNASFRKTFLELFPGLQVPDDVSGACCAQFAVTRDQIRKRPRSDYERYRKWLMETPMSDDLSGRLLEFSWHIMFGRPSVFCPDAPECYCRLYGLCGLHCVDQGYCGSQWYMPPAQSLPEGWPEVGWRGMPQNVTALREEQELDYRPLLESPA